MQLRCKEKRITVALDKSRLGVSVEAMKLFFLFGSSAYSLRLID